MHKEETTGRGCLTKLGASGKKEVQKKILSYILRDNFGFSRKKVGR